MKDLAISLTKSHEDNVRVLKIIKKELVVKCKHPKKMRYNAADAVKEKRYDWKVLRVLHEG